MAMPVEAPADSRLEIAHVLAMDLIGYCRLLIDEQSRLIGELTQIVRGTDRFRAAEAAGKLLRLPTGDGMFLVFYDDQEAPLECRCRSVPRSKAIPGFVCAWGFTAALIELARYEEGISALGRAYELGGRTSRLLGYLGHAHGRAGQTERARECLTELEVRAQRHDYLPPYFPALVLGGLGDNERALDRLEQAYREGDTMLRDLKADPHWDRMRSLPRFDELMRKTAYPETSAS